MLTRLGLVLAGSDDLEGEAGSVLMLPVSMSVASLPSRAAWSRRSRVTAAILILVAVLLGSGILATRRTSRPRPPATVDALLQSIGVNVHLSYFDTSYGNFPLLRLRLEQLGLRHLRDGACSGCPTQQQEIAELGREGYRFDLLMGSPQQGEAKLPGLLDSVAALPVGSVDALEGPNEFDSSGLADWPALLRSYQQRLRQLRDAVPALRHVPVVAPSLVAQASRARLGELGDAAQFGNLHSYPGAKAPGANLSSELALASLVSGAAPVIATETGYDTSPLPGPPLPPVTEDLQARLLPLLYLDYFAVGISRTYLYELADEKPDPTGANGEQHFGLLRQDLSPKPVFGVLARMIALLRVIGSGPLQASPWAATRVEGAGVRHLLLGAAQRRVLVVLWPDDRHLSALQLGSLTPRTVTLHFAKAPRQLTVFRPLEGSSGFLLAPAQAVSLSVGAEPVLVVVQ